MRRVHSMVAIVAASIGLVWASAQPPAEPQPGPATFRIFIKGRDAGSERVSLSRSEMGWVITASGRLEAPLNLTTERFEVRYDRDWRPLLLSIEANLRGQRLVLRSTVDGTSLTTDLTQGTDTTSSTATISADALLLPNNFFAGYEALGARLLGSAPGDELPLYVAPQAEIKGRLDKVGVERIQVPGAVVEARRHHITLMNPGGELPAEVWTDQRARLVRLRIPAASLEVVREDLTTVMARTQTLTREGDEDTRATGNGFNLAATVSKPKPIADPGRRWPAVVLVPGSGPQDRDETVAGIPVFGHLANALADAGFLVARYDKRGVGQSGGRAETATLADYAEDARALVRHVSRRRDVDPTRIAIVGHSEGGWIALLTAAREKRVAALVLVAAPATTGAELILEQQQHALDLMKAPEAERQTKVALQRRIHAAVIGGAGWESVPEELRRQADTPWFKSFLLFDPADAMERTRQPILVVQGSLDRQVPPHHASRLADLARGRKKAGAVETIAIDGVNHLLVAATTGEVAEYPTLSDRAVSPAVLAAMTAWLRKALAPKPARS